MDLSGNSGISVLVSGGASGSGPALVAGAAAGSLLTLTLAPGSLRTGPYGSALVFDAITLFVLLVPHSRPLLTVL